MSAKSDPIAYAYENPGKRARPVWPARVIFLFDHARKQCAKGVPIETCYVTARDAWNEEKKARKTYRSIPLRERASASGGDATSRTGYFPTRKRNRLCDDDSFSGQD